MEENTGYDSVRERGGLVEFFQTKKSKCSLCNKSGHNRQTCKKAKRCSVCKRKGHAKTSCKKVEKRVKKQQKAVVKAAMKKDRTRNVNLNIPLAVKFIEPIVFKKVVDREDELNGMRKIVDSLLTHNKDEKDRSMVSKGVQADEIERTREASDMIPPTLVDAGQQTD
jgi:hypothetical protein